MQQAVVHYENDEENEAINKWLKLLIAPGSSLGGARPKANIMDENNGLWIAKFPSKNDTIDKAAWEFLTYKLAINAGVEMSECRMEKVNGQYHTFFTKRFDRIGTDRIHFSSAMTMTGNNEDTIKDNPASYLDIVEFIQDNGDYVDENLAQFWETIYNPNFKPVEFDGFRKQAGLNSFVMTPKRWIESTGAVGIVSKSITSIPMR